MSWQEDLGQWAIIVLVLYCMVGLFLTYPCLVIASYANDLYGLDVGFYAWFLSLGILGLLCWLRQIWLIVIIYLVTLIPFIFICIGWWKEWYGG